MFRTLVLIISFFIFFQSKSQSSIEFAITSYDFGMVDEDELELSYSFKFINLSKNPIQIGSVEVSCDCLSPSWSLDFIAPRDTGLVTVALNITNRPGNFEKTAVVRLDNNEELYSLSISGMVIPKHATPLKAMNERVGNIGFSSSIIALGTVEKDAVYKREISLYNYDTVAISVERRQADLPSFMKISVDSVIAPQSFGKLLLSFNPDKSANLGYQVYSIGLLLDSLKIPFVVSATIMDPAIPLDGDKKPKLVFDKTAYDFKSTIIGNKLSTDFKLINIGEETLIIKDIQTNCACTIANIKERKLKPGEETNMNVVFDTDGRRGRQYKMITVFSNDPLAPAQTVSLKAILNN